MKRVLLILTAFVFSLVFQHNFCLADDSYYLRDYDGIEIQKGAFIPVVNMQELSTAYSDAGAPAKFVASSDMYLYETIVVPKNTEFFGYVEKVNEPVVGTNGSMVIKVDKMRFVDGFEIPINGYIYSSNGNVIGGELTRPLKYDRMPHYQQGLGTGTLQYVPGAQRSMGDNTVVAAGAELMIILTKPVYVTHTLTD